MRTLLFFSALLLIQLTGQAQTGPGGVGTSTTNVLWLKGDGLSSLSDGNNVSTWYDLSGNNKHAIEPTIGFQPIYKTGIVNGNPVVRFTAASNHRLLSAAAGSGNSASIWVVAKYSSLPSSNPGLIHAAPSGLAFDGSPGNKSIGIWVESTGKLWGRCVQSNTTQCNISKVTTLSSGTFYIINTICNGTTTIQQYVNGGTSGSVAYNGTIQSWTDIGIGRQATESWNGDIAEVICFNTALNQAQRIIIDNYLAAKYGLGITNSFYSFRATHGNEVAGIGRVDASNQQTESQGSSTVKISNPTDLGNNEYLFWGHDNASITTPNLSDVPAGINNRLNRVWKVDETGDVGNVDITFELTGFQVADLDDIQLLVDNNGTFSSGATLYTRTSAKAGGTVSFSGINLTAGQYFTLGSTTGSTILPIELTEFTVEKDGKNALVRWSTSSEINNDHFEVQRSQDGFEFYSFTNVKGAGTSNKINRYQAVDYNIPSGTIYYRLKQVDVNGQSETFQIVVLNNEKQESSSECRMEVNPNPCIGKCFVMFRECNEDNFKDAKVSVFDALGNIVYVTSSQTITEGQAEFTIDASSNLKPAIYIIRGGTESNQKDKKVIIKN